MLIAEPLNTCSRWPKGLCKFKGGVGGGACPGLVLWPSLAPVFLKMESFPQLCQRDNDADFEDGGRWLLET